MPRITITFSGDTEDFIPDTVDVRFEKVQRLDDIGPDLDRCFRRWFAVDDVPRGTSPAVHTEAPRPAVATEDPKRDRKDVPGDFYPFHTVIDGTGCESIVPTEDRGQWDRHKRDIRAALWRWKEGWKEGAEAAIIPSRFGIGPEEHAVAMAPVFPLPVSLAEPCRRLGFARLAMAALATRGNPEGSFESFPTATDCPWPFPGVGISSGAMGHLRSFHAEAVCAIPHAYAAYMARIGATRESWNPMAGPAPEAMDTQAFDAMHHPGEWQRPDLDTAEPLLPLTER